MKNTYHGFPILPSKIWTLIAIAVGRLLSDSPRSLCRPAPGLERDDFRSTQSRHCERSEAIQESSRPTALGSPRRFAPRDDACDSDRSHPALRIRGLTRPSTPRRLRDEAGGAGSSQRRQKQRFATSPSPCGCSLCGSRGRWARPIGSVSSTTRPRSRRLRQDAGPLGSKLNRFYGVDRFGREADNVKIGSKVRSRRIADVAGRALGRLSWAEALIG